MGEAAVSTSGGLGSFQIFEYSEMSVATVVGRNSVHKCSAAQSAVSGRMAASMAASAMSPLNRRMGVSPGDVFGSSDRILLQQNRLRRRPFKVISEP